MAALDLIEIIVLWLYGEHTLNVWTWKPPCDIVTCYGFQSINTCLLTKRRIVERHMFPSGLWVWVHPSPGTKQDASHPFPAEAHGVPLTAPRWRIDACVALKSRKFWVYRRDHTARGLNQRMCVCVRVWDQVRFQASHLAQSCSVGVELKCQVRASLAAAEQTQVLPLPPRDQRLRSIN